MTYGLRRMGPAGRSHRFRVPWVPLLLTSLAVVAPTASVLAPTSAMAAVAAAPAPPRGEVVLAASTTGPVVVVGIPGLRWDQVSAEATPSLWGLAERGALGAVSVRGPGYWCPLDGWATLSAGNRALGPEGGTYDCPAGYPPAPPQREATGWRSPASLEAAAQNLDSPDGSVVGSLGSGLDGVCAVGTASDIAAADTTGWLPRYESSLDSDLGGVFRECAATVVAVDDLALSQDAERALAAVDEKVARVVDALPDASTLLLLGTSEVWWDPEHLHVAMAVGPTYPRGRLTSASTQHAPYVQLRDVAPTVLELDGRPVPTSMQGRPWSAVPSDEPTGDVVSDLLDRSSAAFTANSVRDGFMDGFIVLLSCGILLCGVLLALARAVPGLAVVLRVLACATGALVAASYAVEVTGWWRAADPAAALWVRTLAIAAGIGFVAALGPWRRRLWGPPLFLAGVVVAIFLLDILGTSELCTDSMFGYSTIIGARFTGLGNVESAQFATGALICIALGAGFLASARQRVAVVLVAGGVAVALSFAVSFGNDFGGGLSLTPGVLIVALLAWGRRIAVWKVLAVLVVAGLVAGLAAWLDSLRPPEDQGHLGRFWESLSNGEARPTIERKLSAAADMWRTSDWRLVFLAAVVVALVALALNLAGTRGALAAWPPYVWGLWGVATMAAVGGLVNDSGVNTPASALALAVPASIALVTVSVALARRARRTAVRESPPVVTPV